MFKSTVISNNIPDKSLIKNSLEISGFFLACLINLFCSNANAEAIGTVIDRADKTKVLICHNPLSSQETISISPSALATHVGHHDDYDGPCMTALCTSNAKNITFASLDKNLVYSVAGQDFPSHFSYTGLNGNNVWSMNIKGSSAASSTAFDPATRDTRTTNGSGVPWENPMWPNASGVWFNGIYPNELIDYQFSFTRVSGTDPLNLYMHTGESLDDEKDTLTTNGSDWVLGRYGKITEAPSVSGKTAVFEDNGIVKGVDTGVGYWEISTSFSGNSGVINWNYDYLDSDMTYMGTNMVSFEVAENCGPGIEGTVFSDDNGNDRFTSGETGFPNIAVWRQTVNADGTIDPLKFSVDTDALGNYKLDGLPDGDYQIHVDIADADLPAGYQFGGTNPLSVSIKGSNVSKVDFPFDELACLAFSGEVTEAGLPISTQLKTADKLFLPSRSVSSKEGHLRAYAIDKDGKPLATASWDAATQMDSAARKAKLYSTAADGKLSLFDSLDNAAFSSDPATTRTDTFAAVMGAVSRGNSLDILSNAINTSLYLYDTKYRDFYSKVVSVRDKRVLVSTDDGFLYAFDYDTGALIWGWMPRSLVTELADPTGFQGKHLMAGSLKVLDLPDPKGNYKTYIIGSYKNGRGHFVLKLKADTTLEKVIWDDDQSSAFVKSPNKGEMEFFKEGNGQVYAIYILTNNVNTSRIVIKSLADTTTDLTIDLNYRVSSTPFIMQDYGKRNAPHKKTLYVGSDNGEIHAVSVLDVGGSVDTSSNIKTGLESAAVATLDDSPTDEVVYINSSIAAKDNRYYLSAQTPTRLTVFMYDSPTTTWKKKWTSYVSGAGSWNENGTYSADNSGVPADQGGFFIVPPATGIQSLPADATITDKAVIVGDTLVLPLRVLSASSTSCNGKALYYLYSLTDGQFPKTSFFKTDNTAIETNIVLGYGEARQLTLSDLLGKDQLLGYGLADKKVDFSIGLGSPFVIKDPVATGIRGWKELGR